jgi:3-oxoacyl-[acyl-carrier-protein] synthase II
VSKRRVVVTGLGMLSPLGNTVADSWAGAVAGRSGIGPITRFDTTGFPTTIAGSIPDFDVTKYMPAKEARRMDLFMQFGVAAGVQAIADSGLEVTDANRARIGLVFGAGIGGLATIEDNYGKYLETKTPRKISPFYIPASIVNMTSGHLSIMYGITGPNLAVITACTTSTHAVGVGLRTIQYGDADVVVAGGSEMAQTPTALGGFSQAKALSTRNDEPTKASRPWDRDRDGFVMGDGAGILVLEDRERAVARGARIYCELIGFGMSGDAYHMTAPSESGEGAARCMRNAIRDAGIAPEQVGYINAHGTSTPAGDLAETRAVKAALGEHAYRTMVSSTKSMTGHLLGAAGGIEAVFSAMALHDGVIPPTINLDNPSEECDLDYVPHVAREAKVEIAMSNSFGFGGTNGTLVFRRA